MNRTPKPRRTSAETSAHHETLERTEFGRVLQTMRLSRQISIRALSKKLGWTTWNLAKLETQTPSPTLRIMSEIAFALGMKLGAFFTEYDRIIAEEGTR